MDPNAGDVEMVEKKPSTGENDQEIVEAGRIRALKDVYWKSEEECRMRNASLTAFELHQLKEHAWPEPAKQAVARVVNMFGKPRGPTHACRTLINLVLLEQKVTPGEVADTRSVGFILAKHMMLGQWKSVFGEVALTPSPTDESLTVCHCLPKYSFMLAGCQHKKIGLSADKFYLERVCIACAECLRCHG